MESDNKRYDRIAFYSLIASIIITTLIEYPFFKDDNVNIYLMHITSLIVVFLIGYLSSFVLLWLKAINNKQLFIKMFISKWEMILIPDIIFLLSNLILKAS